MRSPLLRTFLIASACIPLAACGGNKDSAPATPLPPEVTQCATCHTFNEGGTSRTGPNLYDIVGKPAGKVQGFKYSKALETAGITWTEDQLNAYLESPRTAVPGTRMVFTGETDAKKRQAIIDFMKSQSPAK